MAAFALVARKAPSLLAFAKARAAGHWHPISGMARGPGDTHRRDLLAPLSPTGLRPVCQRIWRPWPRGQALAPLVVLEGHYGLALAGPAYLSSQAMPWASGLPNVPRHGAITSFRCWGPR
jgi:hypothetical protein